MSTDGSDSSPLDSSTSKAPAINVTLPTPENPDTQSDEDEEPPQLSSEQLLRRASFKKILEDLSSSADALNKPQSTHGTVTPSQVSVLQQAAGLAAAANVNPALLPLLQNLQQSALASAVANQAVVAPPPPPPPPHPPTDFTQQLAAMMLPGAAQLNAQQQLTAALLSQQQQQQIANTQSPLIANAASIASHNNLQLPANLLSSALLNASTNPLANFGAQLASTGGSSLNSLNKPSLRTVSSPDTLSTSPLGGGGGGEDGTKKREVRLMKNREAARECRRKKKEYIRCLENRVAVLESQNQALIGELRALKELYLPKNQE